MAKLLLKFLCNRAHAFEMDEISILFLSNADVAANVENMRFQLMIFSILRVSVVIKIRDTVIVKFPFEGLCCL